MALLIGVFLAGRWNSPTSGPAVTWHGERLGGPNNAFFGAISPDGREAAVAAFDNGLTQLGVMMLESGNWNRLTTNRDRGLVGNTSSWSRNGADIYYSRLLGTRSAIYRISKYGADDRLILGNATIPQVLPDEAVRERPNSILARVARAQVREDHAMDTSNPHFAELAIQDANVAGAMMPNNPVVLNIRLFALLAAAGLHETTGQPARVEPLLQLARQDVEALGKFDRIPAAIFARLLYFRYTGQHSEYYREAQHAAEHTERVLQYALSLYEQKDFSRAAEMPDRRGQNLSLMESLLRGFILVELPDGTARSKAAYEDAEQRYPRGDAVIYSKTILLLAGLKDEARHAYNAAKNQKDRLPNANAEFWNVLLRFCCGEISASDLLRVAGLSRRNQCMAHYMIGLTRLAEGDRAAARDHFQKCVGTRCFYFYDFEFSDAFLRRMERDPNWPPWIPVKEAGK